MAKFDTTEVFALMKRRGFVPTNTGSFTESDFLLAASEEIEAHILPKLIEAKSKHLFQTKTHALVASTATYRIPDRCAAILAVWLRQSDGRETPLDEEEVERIPFLGINANQTGTPRFYTIEGQFLTLYPTPVGASGTLVIKYQLRPSRLVKVSEAGLITSVAGYPNSVAYSAGSNLTGATVFDIIRAKGFDLIAVDITGAGGGGSVTATAQIPAEAAVNDYVCVAGETPIPNLPMGLHLPAAMRGVGSIIAAKGDFQLAAWLANEAEKKEAAVLNSLVPRNKDEQQDIVNPDW